MKKLEEWWEMVSPRPLAFTITNMSEPSRLYLLDEREDYCEPVPLPVTWNVLPNCESRIFLMKT